MIKTDVTISGGGYTASFRSDLGGNCYRLIHEISGSDILRTPGDESELFSSVFLFGNAILFPPNRVRGGSFEFGGKTYKFPINEPKTGCHLHGELYKTPFKIKEQSESSVTFEYKAEAGEYLGFPHAFSILRKYELSEEGMTETVSVTNLSDSDMPFMLAFHTTFNAPFVSGSKTDDCFFKSGVISEHIRDENYLPTLEYIGGREREILMNAGEYPVSSSALSAFYKNSGSESILTDKRSGLSIVYTASEKYGYRMLWRKDGAPYFVCEPQTCAIDCFHLDTDPISSGLVVVCPGETENLVTNFKIAKKCK